MSKRIAIGVSITVLIILIAAALVSRFIRVRSTPSAAPCVNRLMVIDGAKKQWAIFNSKTADDVPTWQDLRPYLPDEWTNYCWTNGHPVCPAGGTYTVGRVGVHPTCSLGGTRHSYPE